MTEERTMQSRVEEYLCYRRSLGYRLKVEGAQLLDFAQYADKEGCGGHLTTELTLRWVRLPRNCSPLYWARRLEVIRCFARYVAVFDPLSEVPPKGILGPAHRRTTPHIYSEKEIGLLLKACGELKAVSGLRPHTYTTLFGLLSCTGLRISEAIKLTDGDVDLDRGVLTIRDLGRSLGEIIQIVDNLIKKQVRFIAVKQGMTINGRNDIQTKVMITLFGLFAEIERDLLSERTKMGLENARAKWKKLGRPVGRLGKHKQDGKEGEIKELLGYRVSKAAIARKLGVSRTCMVDFIQKRKIS